MGRIKKKSHPQKPVFSWTGAAQSRRSEPFGVARAACFEQLAGHCQLRCPALRKDLSQSEDKERYIPDTSELRSERLYVLKHTLPFTLPFKSVGTDFPSNLYRRYQKTGK